VEIADLCALENPDDGRNINMFSTIAATRLAAVL
jgi:hypothetical protein